MAAVWSTGIFLALLFAAPPAAADPAAAVGAEVEGLRHTVADQQRRLDELEHRLEAAGPDPGLAEERGAALDSSLRLQGYMVAALKRFEGEPSTFDQEEFSLYFNSPLNDRLNVFAEIEFFHDRRQIDAASGAVEDVAQVRLERALLDFHPRDAVQARFGKFLTPFGSWIVNHADPLQLTTSRPLVVEEVVPEASTGLLGLGTLFFGAWEADYRLWLANGRGRDPDRHDANFRKAYGGRVAVRPGSWLEVGASLLDDADDRFADAHETDYGLDFRWRVERVEVKGEGVVSGARGVDSPGSPEGGFLQGAVTWGRVTPVARYEWFRGRAARRADRRTVAGVVLHILSPLVIKGEVQLRQGGDREGSDGAFLASVATFF
ncbi:MAG: hypothetical protein COW73_02210 [Nitrospirae bacterium CG18_big_fil_WC_8_21_14_2_50_70_55]|nr:hypothetical protein [Deltaproteobacteria bacterium]OIP65246.1 MAG: hypothetical protein AUK30_05000 [Nitrospirae bacterium CG2_30_70_394]PIQ06797.1 MAG: hypothetical protein COW73_02210 [Nitrospirae bacterium CG18_big_fil_WC_8_21_14_2_50_70_55]PIU78469.1 MAG: hypothetical protein COS73_07130 [Nitrospirae bacterium CG06_land_8_20_14_3_00_70_43]PIX83472.1 MAG: hypothetical protein COZ33_05285 [Nitrospirae bacterium CG_4_10_14_3_um_filter_70_108]PJB96800.1 MAG: hypothetical protein CO080_0209